jgi:hypothetical protein
MIFFTRALQDGIQEESGWTRRACATFARNQKLYAAYVKLITPLLPRSIVRVCREGLHDAQIESVSQHRIRFVMDARSSLGGFRGRRLQLTFEGVLRRIATRGLVGEWWLYEEVHLSSHAAFSLHALCSTREFEIEANHLTIQLLSRE